MTTNAISLPVRVGSLGSESHQSESLLGSLSCDYCQAAFWSRRALHTHMASKHGWRHPARSLVAKHDTVCGCCLLDLRTRPRLLVHLCRSRPECLEAISKWRTPMSVEDRKEADAHDEKEPKRLRALGKHHAWAELPSVRLAAKAGLSGLLEATWFVYRVGYFFLALSNQVDTATPAGE